ncbi:MAG: glycosyltransferase [Candidatus Dormiibacterota bacterium]
MISGVAVVVPACNEEARIGECLLSVRRAVQRVREQGRRTLLVVVADACTDATERCAIATAPEAEVVRVDFHCVGAARAMGAAHALAELAAIPAEQIWVASTDADGTVPDDWIDRQLRHAARGADAVAGLVEVDDWSDRAPEVRRHYAAYLHAAGAGPGHPHVHGANLGFTAGAYQRSGGWRPLASGEDVALWRALLASGVHCHRARDVVVRTSGRRDSRVSAGFGSFLDRLPGGEPGLPTLS